MFWIHDLKSQVQRTAKEFYRSEEYQAKLVADVLTNEPEQHIPEELID